MKYTKEELEILEAVQNDTLEKVEFDNEKIVKMASQTLEYMNEHHSAPFGSGDEYLL